MFQAAIARFFTAQPVFAMLLQQKPRVTLSVALFIISA